MRALVTGADGFVGGHLVRHLRDEGDDVTEVDRDRADVRDAEAMRDLVAETKPEVVYHLAGQADVGGSWGAPSETFQINAVGTLHVLHACSELGVDRVLAVASADVYGHVQEADLPIDEDFPLCPVSPYAASKVAVDFLAVQAHLGWGLDVVRVRPFNHLGVGQSDKFVASALARRIARNERDGGRLVPVGNLSTRRDFTDVRDVARAYRLVMDRGEAGAVYNVCSGRDVSVQEIADQLLALATREMHLDPDPELHRPVDTPVLRGDSSRLRNVTGWEPEIPLEKTLVDLLEDWRQRVRTES